MHQRMSYFVGFCRLLSCFVASFGFFAEATKDDILSKSEVRKPKAEAEKILPEEEHLDRVCVQLPDVGLAHF